MTLLGNQDTGLGNVDTAGQVPGGGGGGGGDAGVIAKFTGGVTTTESPTFGYLADPGQNFIATAGVPEPAPQLYPTAARTFSVMRVTATGGGSATSSDYTVTLYQNGVATAQQVTVPHGTAAGTVIADDAHPITFALDDKYDVRWDIAAGDGSTLALAVVLEGPAGGGSGGTGEVHSDVSGLTFPLIGGVPTLTAADPVVLPGLDVENDFTSETSAHLDGTTDITGTLDVIGETTLDGVTALIGSATLNGLPLLAGYLPANVDLPRQLANFNTALVHPPLWCECYTTNGGAAVDYTPNGSVFAAGPAPSSISATTVGTGGARSQATVLGVPFFTPNTKRTTWAAGGRSAVTLWGNDGWLALAAVEMGDGTVCAIGMNAAVSNDFVSVFIMSPTNVLLGNPILTSVPFAAVFKISGDFAIIWDNVSVRAYFGDQRTQTPLTLVGEMEDGNELSEAAGFPFIGAQTGGADCQVTTDYFYAIPGLMP